MNDGVRKGLGLLVIAVLALVVGLAFGQGESDFAYVVQGITRVLALVAGLVGLILIAAGLLRVKQ